MVGIHFPVLDIEGLDRYLELWVTQLVSASVRGQISLNGTHGAHVVVEYVRGSVKCRLRYSRALSNLPSWDVE